MQLQTPAPAAAAPCLTHHEILRLTEPFDSQGYRLNLAASDRLQRRLRFEPGAAGTSTTRESLLLDSPAEGRLQLTRSLEIEGAAPATLQCEGDDAAALLQSLQSADPARQFVRGDGYLISCHRELRADGRSVLYGAEAQLPGLSLTLSAPRGGSGDASVQLQPDAGRLHLPEDLFAVLGRDWSLLRPEGRGWRFTLRVRGGNAAALFERGVRHLREVLAETPQRFHERHLAARWAVSARRSMLVAAWATLLLLVAVAQPLWLARASAWPLLLAAVPLALLWGCYQSPDLPRLQWLRRPRAPALSSWLEPGT